MNIKQLNKNIKNVNINHFLGTLTILQLLWTTQGKLTSFNLTASGCSFENSAYLLTDGDRETTVEVDSKCIIISVFLRVISSIHYILIYGKTYDDSMVLYKATGNDVKSFDCEFYVGKQESLDNPIKITCQPYRVTSLNIVIGHEGMTLAEIELYSLGETKRQLYFGCFTYAENAEWLSKKRECMEECDKNKTLFVLEMGGHCGCSYRMPRDWRPTSECRAERAYSTYLMPRLLTFRSMKCTNYYKQHVGEPLEGMTVNKCLRYCSSSEAVMAVVIASDSCYCTNVETDYMLVDLDECRKELLPCSGDKSILCGGTRIFVTYSDYYHKSIDKSVFDLVHCDIGMKGWCLGDCYPGWTGRFCILEMDKDEAGCSTCDYSTMDCIKFKDVYKCICKNGFASLNGRDCQKYTFTETKGIKPTTILIIVLLTSIFLSFSIYMTLAMHNMYTYYSRKNVKAKLELPK